MSTHYLNNSSIVSIISILLFEYRHSYRYIDIFDNHLRRIR